MKTEMIISTILLGFLFALAVFFTSMTQGTLARSVCLFILLSLCSYHLFRANRGLSIDGPLLSKCMLFASITTPVVGNIA